ncbi:MAG: bifunctional 1-(5-phosphoribosyl)-5-((5-phosphoribosylamino)methylideneamino)imidazole-4-carboxamide isomerase/phosphoribosylanthranilate isomerase PriA [Propionibacteriaceae bacterium]|jgi:phosphoribosylanthranilate isomerase|nr:bifunctional 1-(5-phosphoribosyl)-5-((5-phosphoribosylamino)methylideneamino)imidazole-4-carboxamide isomerase/phosphoribosylanthranilate isomerase PriA [Propionibacteriaceae bacterium]
MSGLTLLPAVDVQSGQAVQLVQGRSGSAQVFGDPVAAAQRWRDEGAEWLHLVDLDAAFGHGSNAQVTARIVAEVDLKVELSGGIRDQASLERALESGCQRVNLGTAALEYPAWCAQAIAQWPEQVAISLDVKHGRLAGRGWTSLGGPLEETVARLDQAGCRRYVVTDVASDGTLSGPNLELLAQVCRQTEAKVTASGGIASLDDLIHLSELSESGLDAAIVGTALYVGAFTLAQAQAVLGPGS